MGKLYLRKSTEQSVEFKTVSTRRKLIKGTLDIHPSDMKFVKNPERG